MRRIVTVVLLTVLVAACSGKDGGKYIISFRPFSASLDAPAQSAIHNAAIFAKAYPLAPISIDGYRTPPDPDEIPTLRQLRVQTVRQALINEGVDSFRIEVLGDRGMIYSDDIPKEPTGQVAVSIGL
jgi:outer membrane protein OmpA-like peptidoglycan-associated protein